MFTRCFLVVAVLVCSALPAYAGAEPVRSEPDRTTVLRACAAKAADSLPNPYRDLRSDDWAYRAVLSMHYCGAYRGAVPPERLGASPTGS